MLGPVRCHANAATTPLCMKGAKGCPYFQGADLAWAFEACSWRSSDYRRVQEIAYMNLDGASSESIYLLMLAFPLIVMAHATLRWTPEKAVAVAGNKSLTLRSSFWVALYDASIVALPLTFYFSTHLEWSFLLLVIAPVLEFRRCIKGGICWEAKFTLEDGRLRFLSEYRAMVMMSTCIAILAVDFSSLFSRSHCKTEEFGYSLMDVGTGSIIFCSAVTPKSHRSKRGLGILKLWPVLLIGFVRAAFIWGIDYHVPPGEYGVHWNFFFTIAVVSLVSEAADFAATSSLAAALVVLGAYQWYLSQLGGATAPKKEASRIYASRPACRPVFRKPGRHPELCWIHGSTLAWSWCRLSFEALFTFAVCIAVLLYRCCWVHHSSSFCNVWAPHVKKDVQPAVRDFHSVTQLLDVGAVGDGGRFGRKTQAAHVTCAGRSPRLHAANLPFGQPAHWCC
ncbi:unnamed protein product [Durusdinium trenchii]|uniref:GPI-anchored wall transfer protein 1 n=1 Tax=Durusdinium trenchii TaxID=1381693 RepID=A0ABP0ST07_9DINO